MKKRDDLILRSSRLLEYTGISNVIIKKGIDDSDIDGIASVLLKIQKSKHLNHKFSERGLGEFFSEMTQFLCLFYSAENYKPNRIIRFFNTYFNKLGGNPQYPYGWFGGLNVKNNAYSRDYRNEIKRSAIGALLFDIIDYFILNEDWERLEKFSIQYRKCISPDYLERAAIAITVATNRDPSHKMLTPLFVRDWDQAISIGSQDVYNINEIDMHYFTVKNITPNTKHLYKLMDKILTQQDNNWFRDALKSTGRKSTSVENFSSVFSSGETYLKYPKWHLFSKGFPSCGFGSTSGAILLFNTDSIKQRYRELKNEMRKQIGLPNLGEGWVSETKLLNNVKNWVANYKVVPQWSPRWLGKQRIDVGIPSLKIGIEWHGTQHFEPVDFFGGQAAYKKQRELDKKKILLCKKNGTLLLEFKQGDSDKYIKDKILSAVKKQESKTKVK
jgi:hypothetical protein